MSTQENARSDTTRTNFGRATTATAMANFKRILQEKSKYFRANIHISSHKYLKARVSLYLYASGMATKSSRIEPKIPARWRRTTVGRHKDHIPTTTTTRTVWASFSYIYYILDPVLLEHTYTLTHTHTQAIQAA